MATQSSASSSSESWHCCKPSHEIRTHLEWWDILLGFNIHHSKKDGDKVGAGAEEGSQEYLLQGTHGWQKDMEEAAGIAMIQGT